MFINNNNNNNNNNNDNNNNNNCYYYYGHKILKFGMLRVCIGQKP